MPNVPDTVVLTDEKKSDRVHERRAQGPGCARWMTGYPGIQVSLDVRQDRSPDAIEK